LVSGGKNQKGWVGANNQLSRKGDPRGESPVGGGKGMCAGGSRKKEQRIRRSEQRPSVRSMQSPKKGVSSRTPRGHGSRAKRGEKKRKSHNRKTWRVWGSVRGIWKEPLGRSGWKETRRTVHASMKQRAKKERLTSPPSPQKRTPGENPLLRQLALPSGKWKIL